MPHNNPCKDSDQALVNIQLLTMKVSLGQLSSFLHLLYMQLRLVHFACAIFLTLKKIIYYQPNAWHSSRNTLALLIWIPITPKSSHFHLHFRENTEPQWKERQWA